MSNGGFQFCGLLHKILCVDTSLLKMGGEEGYVSSVQEGARAFMYIQGYVLLYIHEVVYL